MNDILKKINNPDLGSLLFRLSIGGIMAFAHGLSKLPPAEQFVSGVESLGFPMPLYFAWAAALAEFLGGILILCGLFTRHAALFLGFTMAVAAFKAHAADPFNVKEMAILYLTACTLLFFQGAGKYSLDSVLRKK